MSQILDFGSIFIYEDKITHVTIGSPYILTVFIEGREEGIEIPFSSKEERDRVFESIKNSNNIRRLL